MREIKLTKGQVALVDDADFDWLNQWKWYAVKYKNGYYAVRRCVIINKKVYMHRAILNLTNGLILTDHEDRNGLNNQRSNLRVATKAQNAANCKTYLRSSSLYHGVCWCKFYKKWLVRVRRKYVGYYENEILAALAYNKEAEKIYGEFANLNVISNI